jgi:hypothetical protein
MNDVFDRSTLLGGTICSSIRKGDKNKKRNLLTDMPTTLLYQNRVWHANTIITVFSDMPVDNITQ